MLSRCKSAQRKWSTHYDGWILAAAHAPGLEGSIWRTDLWIVVGGSGSGPVTLRFCRSNTDNTEAAEHTVEVVDGKRVIFFEDVVDNATNDAFFVRGVKRMFPSE